MIKATEITSIGRFLKPHGIKGEIAAELDLDCTELESLTCIVCDMDGIFVPFFLTGERSKGRDTALLSIDGVEDERQASEFAGKTVYALAGEVEDSADGDEGMYVTDMAGFTIADTEGALIGTIDYVDDSTANILFVVKTPGGDTAYIPAAEEFIKNLDPDSRTITMQLPDGLL